MPSEKKGILRTPAYYDRIYGEKHWKYSNVYSLSIGQGELGLSPLHMANMACILANRGHYFTPHFVKKVGDKGKPLPQYLERHDTKVDPKHFEAIITGMKWAVQQGTVWSQARMKTIEICGKTGTAQNPHGKNHSIFVCFAPKDDPKVAVAVVVENAGYGATWAGPISTLLMEKYLNDTLTVESKRKSDELANIDLMPESIKEWYIRNNKTDFLAPIEYNNDELSDIWDMEMVPENNPLTKKLADTIQKTMDTNSKKSSPLPIPINSKLNKEAGAFLNNKKKKIPTPK
jgi:membrane peptidoglycan carboxypeptidase